MTADASHHLNIDTKIDRCIDRTLRRTLYGGLVATAAALLLLRSPTARTSIISLGVGFGAGSAYRDCEAEVRVVLLLRGYFLGLERPWQIQVHVCCYLHNHQYDHSWPSHEEC